MQTAYKISFDKEIFISIHITNCNVRYFKLLYDHPHTPRAHRYSTVEIVE